MRRALGGFLLVLGLVVAVAPAAAHNLGVRGTVYPITEPSLLVTMMRKLAAVDWKQKSKELLHEAERHVAHYEQDGLTPARKTRTRWVDPSIVLDHPISAPVRDKDGVPHWRVLYPAGTRINPLTRIRPRQRLLVFDPRVPEQVDFAITALHRWPLLVQLVASGGDIKGVAKKVGRPVFYANRRFVQRFGLVHTPSLIGVGSGARKDDLAVTAFAPDALGADEAARWVKAAWYGLSGDPPVSTSRTNPARAR